MKVLRVTTSDTETSATIDIFEDRKLPKRIKDSVSEEVGKYLVEQTLLSVAASSSPIDGEGKFPKLSKLYKKKKEKDVGHTQPNLEFSGEMLDEVGFDVSSEGLTIGVFGERAPAADGHNNLSGNSNLPKRRFIPDVGQDYKSNIEREVDRIITDAIAQDTGFDPTSFIGVDTKKEIYETLKALFGEGLSNAELRLAVLRNDDLVELLDDLGIIDLL